MSGAIFYVDASVIAGVALRDIDFEYVVAAVPAETALAYSTFGFGEVVSAIAARVRAKHGSDDDAAARLQDLRIFLENWVWVDCTSGDLDRAIVLTAQASLALKLPDAIHIAIAERLGLPLLTSDRQQYRAARSLGLSPILPANPD